MAVKRVTITDDDGGRKLPDDAHSYRVVWQAVTAHPLDTAAAVLASPLLPQPGDPYTGWVETFGVYAPKVVPEDPLAVVVDRRARRSADSPFVWEVTVSYEGVASPFAVPADVDYSEAPYQEQVVQDRFGGFAWNSAGDLYDGGLAADRQRGVLTIGRNVPYDGWDPDAAERFRNTVNLLPYAHGGLVRDGSPVVAPPGSAKIHSLRASRQVARHSPVPADRLYYWRVTAVIEFDYSTFSTVQGWRVPRLWRKVLADVGYHQIVDGKKVPIRFGNQPASAPQLLNGRGKLLTPYGEPPTFSFLSNALPGDGVPVAENDYYQTVKDVPLVVPAPGVLANDHDGLGEKADWTVLPQTMPAHGTLAMAAGGLGGGFTYTPDAGYRGYDSFTYKVNNGGGTNSNEAGVTILVVDPYLPVNVFEVYDPADWSLIDSWVGNW